MSPDIRRVEEIPAWSTFVACDGDIHRRSHTVLIAEVGGELVGVIAYDWVRVCALGVRKDHRRRGIATALYAEMERDINVPRHMWPQSGNLTSDGLALRKSLGMSVR